jgi:hypothetical protein
MKPVGVGVNVGEVQGTVLANGTRMLSNGIDPNRKLA